MRSKYPRFARVGSLKRDVGDMASAVVVPLIWNSLRHRGLYHHCHLRRGSGKDKTQLFYKGLENGGQRFRVSCNVAETVIGHLSILMSFLNCTLRASDVLVQILFLAAI